MAKPKAKVQKNINGTGSVRLLKSGRYQVVVTDGYRESGKRIEVSGGTFTTRQEAEKKRSQMVADRDRGVLETGEKVTLRDYAARLLRRKTDADERTKESWEAEVKLLLTVPWARCLGREEAGPHGTLLGDKALGDIKPHHLKDAVVALSQRIGTSGRGKGKTMAPVTLGKVITHTKFIFREAVSDRLLQRSSAESLRKPRGMPTDTERVGRVLDDDALERFHAVGHALYQARLCRMWPILFTAVSLGLRRGEVLGLRVQDLDLEAQEPLLRVRQALTVAWGQMRIGDTKTPESQRDLYLPRSLQAVLRDHLERRAEDASQAGELGLWVESGLLFANEIGGWPSPYNLYRALVNLLDWTDPDSFGRKIKGVRLEHHAALREVMFAKGAKPVPRISPHDLRHTYATLALKRRVPVEVVSKNLGHSSITLTMNTYRHVLDSEKRRGAVDLFDYLPDPAALKGSGESVASALLN